ncbi:MAG: class GN sortase [Lysobacterales bacterium]
MNLLHALNRHWLLAAVALSAAIFSLDALWIPVKAEIAQHLLERAWLQTLAGEPDAKPWPWADTHAIAVLEVPRLGLREIVLEGSSGRNLAFGPTLVNTGRIERTSDRVLSGHRDTHFSFLKELKTGDLLRLRTRTGISDYRVRWQQAVDSRQQPLRIDEGVDRLTLLTCYPFNSPVGGGPMRWVVTALPES